MGFNADAVRVENQGIAGNPCRALVRLAEPAVYADFLPFRANRAFPFFDLNRRMAVDDMALGRIDAEFMEDFYAFVPIPVEMVIIVLRFFPRRLVDDITPFKGLDNPTRYGGIYAAPQVPHIVQTVRIPLVIGLTGNKIDHIHEGLSLIRLAVEINFFKAAVFIEGNAAVE